MEKVNYKFSGFSHLSNFSYWYALLSHKMKHTFILSWLLLWLSGQAQFHDYSRIVGTNYTTAAVVNEIQMWEQLGDRVDEIDRELGWASSYGMNALRVYLHIEPYKSDKTKFLGNIETFLQLQGLRAGCYFLRILKRGKQVYRGMITHLR